MLKSCDFLSSRRIREHGHREVSAKQRQALAQNLCLHYIYTAAPMIVSESA